MKRIKLKSLKKWIIPVLATTILTTCVGCARNKSVEETYKKQDDIKIENRVDDTQNEINDAYEVIVDENEQEVNQEKGVEKINIDLVILDENTSDLEQLKQYGKIDYLEISDTNIKDFSVLKNIDVKNIQIISNKTSIDLSQFNLDKMESLYIQDTNVNAQNINNCFDNLYEISFINTGLKNVDFIKNAKKLKALNLDSNYLENVRFLNNLESLEVISLSNNKIKKLDGIENCKKLEYLSLAKNKINDINLLANLSNIGYLELSFNDLDDIKVLTKLEKMYSLNITDNNISDITCLRGMSELKNINLGRNRIVNIPINILNENVNLNLRGNMVQDVSQDIIDELSTYKTSSINLFDNYLDNETINKLSDNSGIKYKADYSEFTPKECINYNNEVNRIINNNINNDMSDNEKVMSIYRYFMKNAKIDSKFESDAKYNEYGAILEKKAVCEGYAMGLNSIMKRIGIDSKLYYCDLYTLEDKYDHCINIINTDGKDRLYDLTRDMDEHNIMPKHYGFSNEEAVKQGYYMLSNNIPRITLEDSLTQNQVNELYNWQKDIER